MRRRVYEVLVQGRNLKNSPPMQELLPYNVVLALITNRRLHERHLAVSAQFVTVARSLYVDNQPHVTMCRVRSIRMWGNIHSAALSGKLSSRLVTVPSTRSHEPTLTGFLSVVFTCTVKPHQGTQQPLTPTRLPRQTEECRPTLASLQVAVSA